MYFLKTLLLEIYSWVHGAAIKALKVNNIVIKNCMFVNNTIHITEDYGTGAAIHAMSSNLTVTNTTFISNSVNGFDGRGGALFIRSGSIAVTNCNFTNNSINGDYARSGAIYMYFDNFHRSSSAIFLVLRLPVTV